MRSRTVRILAVTLALALLSASAVAARTHHAPPKPPKRSHPVSNGVPYIAPWQSGFERYSTQIYTPTLVSYDRLSMTIPDGQWWKIVYLNAGLTTAAPLGSRTVNMEITDPAGTVKFSMGAPATQAATSTATYIFGPGLTTFSNQTDVSNEYLSVAIPDVLWPPGFKVALHFSIVSGLDGWNTLRDYAVEVYTEKRDGTFVPVLTPKPLIP